MIDMPIERECRRCGLRGGSGRDGIQRKSRRCTLEIVCVRCGERRRESGRCGGRRRVVDVVRRVRVMWF